ncbi:MAG: CvpA family protein [Treponema sp.]|nr:CvpA family protein [Treponema sp.]
MNFGIIDFVFCLIILTCAIVASIKGFINSVLSKLAVALGILFAVLFNNNLAQIFANRISSFFLCRFLAAVIIFIVVFLIIKVLQKILSIVFSGEILKSLDKTLGFFFGFAGGLIIVLFILKILYIQPFFNLTEIFENSFFHKIFSQFLCFNTNNCNSQIIFPFINDGKNKKDLVSLLYNFFWLKNV